MNRIVLKACLLGGALGDSVGLPSEGMNARRIVLLRPGRLRQSLTASLQAGESVEAYANSISRRPGFVSGFAPETACVAIYAWLRHRGDFRMTIEAVVKAGGDTDTVGFVAGSIAGAECGPDGLAADWLENLRDWPIHAGFIGRITAGNKSRYPNWPLSLIRNMGFLLIVLTHGFRRLFPPY